MYDDYVRGLQALKNLLPREAQSSFAVYEARLLENLHRGQFFGTNENIRTEQAMIIDGLNQLARSYNVTSFNELIYSPQTARVISTNQTLASEHISSTRPPDKKDAHTTPPEITVSLLTHTIPIAYYHLLDVKRFPFVRVLIDNTGPECDDATLAITTMIEGYSDIAKVSFKVPKGEHKEEALLPLLKAPAMDALNTTWSATLHITITQNTPITSVLYDNTKHIRLLDRNTALLGIRENEKVTEDLTKFLAAWVTPYHPKIEEMLRSAADYHPDGEFVGYQGGNMYPDVADNVRAQARAIFQALKKEIDIRYSDPFASQGAAEDQITQHVRLPSQCLASRLANCVEGSVLFASLLEAASIDPIIILIPDHAFVGWRTNRNAKQNTERCHAFVGWRIARHKTQDAGRCHTFSGQHVAREAEQCEFLEMTSIATKDFEPEQQFAQEQFDRALHAGDFDKELFDDQGFARFIDVECCRKEGIYSLK